jgi:TetR/AcrR family transcriptional regulator, transcriptional repressor for nem operon
MRKSRRDTAATRVRIVEAASVEFRRNGIDRTALNDLMSAAGLTHGGFYRHFCSKDQIVAEACAVAANSLIESIAQAVADGSKVDGLAIAANLYLSTDQRDNPGGSCPLAMLGSELARGGEAARSAATDGYLKLVEILAAQTPESRPEDARRKALVAVSAMVGALTMSRVANDAQLSEEILMGMKQALTAAGLLLQ